MADLKDILLQIILGNQGQVPGLPRGTTPPFIPGGIPGLSSGGPLSAGAGPQATPTTFPTSAAPVPAPSAPAPAANDPLSQILNSPTLNPPEPKRRPLDYLVMAAAPLAQGYIAAQTGPRYQANRRFWAGMAGGGVNALASEAARPAQIAEQRRKAAIEALTTGARVQEAFGGSEAVQPVTVVRDGRKVIVDARTGQEVPGGGAAPETTADTPAPITRERRLPDGSMALEQWDAAAKAWVPAQRVVGPGLGTPGGRVPFTSAAPPKEEKPARYRFEVGQGNKLFRVNEDTLEKKDTGIVRFDKPSEGETNRNINQQQQEVAFHFIQKAYEGDAQTPPATTPQEATNRALELFRASAAGTEDVKKYAGDISAQIRRIGAAVTTPDEFADLLWRAINQPTQ